MKSEIKMKEDRLGILLPEFDAVATTLIAGTIVVTKGIARPIGSHTNGKHQACQAN